MSQQNRVKQLLADPNQQGHLFAVLVESKWEPISEADRRAFIQAYARDTSRLNTLGTFQVASLAGLYFAVDRYVPNTSKPKVLLATAALAIGFHFSARSFIRSSLSNSLSDIYSKYNFTTDPEALSILTKRLR